MRYEIIEKLGEGGGGEVFKAFDTKLKRFVAIKIIKKNPRVQREIETAAKLSHPGLVKIFDVEDRGDKIAIIQEYVQGKNLKEVLKRGPLKEEEALDYLIQIAESLNFMHSSGIIHRDLKPSNLLISEKGGVKICDYGISMEKGAESITETGKFSGTIEYSAPERIEGDPGNEKSDAFSLGCILYEMLTGENPFEGESLSEKVDKILRKNPPLPSRKNPEISPKMDLLVSKLLSKKPEKRPSISEVLDYLKSGENLGKKQSVRRPAILFFVVLLLSSLIIFPILLKRGRGETAKIGSLVYTSNDLRAMNSKGKVLWVRNLQGNIKRTLVSDLNGDGSPEVIAGTAHAENIKEWGFLYVFNAKGRQLLKLKMGKGNIYSKDENFEVWDLKIVGGKGRGKKIVAVGINNPYFPSVIRLIPSEDLDKISEENVSTYWHPGVIFSLKFSDENGDGVEDLVVLAVNNQMGHKMVVFCLDGNGFRDQAPPWLGKEVSFSHGLLFYTPLPEGGKQGGSLSIKDGIIRVVFGRGRVVYVDSKGRMTDTYEEAKLAENRPTADVSYIYSMIKISSSYFRSKNWDKALNFLQRALEKCSDENLPLKAFMYFQMGRIFLQKEDPRSALKHFSRASKIDPLYSDAYFFSGYSYYTLLDFKRAVENFALSYSLSGHHWDFYMKALALIRGGDYEKSLRELERFEKVSPTTKQFTHYFMGYSYLQQFEWEKAREFFEKSLGEFTTLPEAYYDLAECYARMGDLKRAAELLREKELKKGHFKRIWIEGLIEYGEGKTQRALSLFEKSLELARSSRDIEVKFEVPRILLDVSKVYIKLGKRERARKTLRSIIDSPYSSLRTKKQARELLNVAI